MKRLKVKVKRICKRKLGQRYQVEMKRLSEELLAAKKKLHRRNFCDQYYEMKATAGLSSTSM
jgi:hypothetical protein